MGAPIRVLLLTEGTYPFRWGGVSTWCDVLTHELSDVSFSLLAIAEGPRLERRFELAPNVEHFRAVSLWGVRDAWEGGFGARSRRATQRRLRSTTRAALRAEFVPSFRRLTRALVRDELEPEELASTFHELHRFFLAHDYATTMRSQEAWQCFVTETANGFPSLAARHGYADAGVSLADATAAFQWLHHWLFPLADPLPRVDVAHAAMAGICSIVASVVKLEQGAGFLLSEHGIYLRECYLAERAVDDGLFRKLFRLRFALLTTEVAYRLADRVLPCCDYNQRWELEVGVDPRRMQTAYYGLNPDDIEEAAPRQNDAPVVVWAGRIDPLKDVETLLRAAAKVLEARPDVQFRLFGSAPPGNEAYLDRCLALHAELGVDGGVRFEGFADRPSEVFAQGDVVVLSSISEGFPYSTLEAMFCGRPIVATAVGGVAEQLGESGRLVRPRDPDALAHAVLELVADRELRVRLGREARMRAESHFTIDRFREVHTRIYESLANPPSEVAA